MGTESALGCCAKHSWFDASLWTIVGTLTQCLPSSIWGNTGGLNTTRKAAGHPTSLCRWPRISAVFNKLSPTYGIVYVANVVLLVNEAYLFRLLVFTSARPVVQSQ